MERLSRAQARRVALAAQGFGVPRPAQVGRRQLGLLTQRLGLLQIDSVNVLTRAHYLPAFSRLGPYDRALLDDCSARAPRTLIEYWAHEASLIPVSTHPLLRFRMRREGLWGSMRRIADDHPGIVSAVLAEIRASGPMTAGEVERSLAHDAPRSRDHWGWNWSLAKQALEHLFWSGQITSAGRTPAFERRYAVPERVLPRSVFEAPDPSDEESWAGLMAIAARAHGVGTLRDLRDYFRLKPAEGEIGLHHLLDAGTVIPVHVEGVARTSYLHRDARLPRRIEARALLAPFDPLVWERSRVEELFGFRYRLEIYTPAAKRVHGYYVLPFLLGESLVARVDLKADRASGELVVRAAYGEPGAPPSTAYELRQSLEEMASWLGLGGISVLERGDLATALARR